MSIHRGLRLSLLLLAAAMAGCSSYSPVPVSEDPVQVAVLPVINESGLPQIVAPLARNLREKVAHSANFELVPAEAAEAKLRVTVLDLDSEALARDSRDTGRPLSYYEEVRVSVEWISDLPAPWGTDQPIIVSADQILYAQPALVDARTNATAGVAERLAEMIVQRLDWAGSASTN
ncbi:MAG: LPS assembly lipoprotein LptE [Opitutales bacterium]|jgi:hypothetical protein